MSDPPLDPAAACLETARLIVVPSEVLARRWQREAARRSESNVVRADRIISWDRFKQRAVPVRRSQKPADSLVRLAFAQALVAENARDPFLTRLVEPQWAEHGSSAVDSLVALLPLLPRVLAGREALRSDLVADLTAVEERYLRFLDHHDRYEPEWEEHRVVESPDWQERPIIFWPALLEDFARYEALLGSTIEVAALPPVSDEAAITVVGTIEQEIERACTLIEEALERGVEPTDIVVSIADREAVESRFAAAALRRSIPVHQAAGTALSQSPFGMLMARVGEAVAADCSVRELDSLLSFRGLPPSDHDDQQLLRFGYRVHAYSDDAWHRAFASALRIVQHTDEEHRASVLRKLGLVAGSQDPSGEQTIATVRSRYRTVAKACRAAVGADTVKNLAQAVHELRALLVAEVGSRLWSHPAAAHAERQLESALNQLRDLERLGASGIDVPSPWSAFLHALASARYVARAEGASIAIYDWRVAAGAPAELHIVLNCSQGATRVPPLKPPFVNRDEAEHLAGLGVDRSSAFLRAYSTLGGRSVLSCATAGAAGAQVPAPELALAQPDLLAGENAWLGEERWWSDSGAAAPARLYPLQQLGLAAACRLALRAPADDLQQGPPISAPVRLRLAAIDRMSAAAFEQLARCPFSFFLRYVVEVRDEAISFDPDNLMEAGNALHDAIRGVLELPDSERSREAVAAAVERAFSRGTTRLLLSRTALAEQITFYADAIIELVESGAFASGSSERFEETVESAIGLPDSTFTIFGRLDRLVEHEDGTFTIEDFKRSRGSTHGAAAVFPPGSESLLESTRPQLAVYAAALASAGRGVPRRLAYIAVRDARAVDALRTGGSRVAGTAAATLERYVENLSGDLERLRERFAAGDLGCRESPGDCSECRSRELCRSCYNAARRLDV